MAGPFRVVAGGFVDDDELIVGVLEPEEDAEEVEGDEDE